MAQMQGIQNPVLNRCSYRELITNSIPTHDHNSIQASKPAQLPPLDVNEWQEKCTIFQHSFYKKHALFYKHQIEHSLTKKVIK